MRNKSIIFLFVLIFMVVFSLSAVSADDSQNTDFNVVSGDVDVVTVNPWDTTGQLEYAIPSEAKDIKSADLYVNVYSGSAQNTRGANANVSLNTTSGVKQIASEQLWIEDGSSDGTIYPVNDHVNKCYSDYQMYYDITDSLKGLNGSSITIKVDTFKMEGKEFDGRIKLIALVLGYDDGDDDTITYWVDSTQKWTKTNVTTTFATQIAYNVTNADLINVALSSADGSYMLNDELLANPTTHASGNYYQYNRWNVTGNIKEGNATEFFSKNLGTGTYSSLKNVLTVLKLQSDVITADVSFKTEYTSVETCFAGTSNGLTVTAKADKNGTYVVELLADGVVVDSTEIALDGVNANTTLLIDPTIRPVDEKTVSGANNTKVKYDVNVKYEGSVVGTATKTVPVLYDGYLGKDFAYNATYIEYAGSIAVTGGISINIQDKGTYLAAKAYNRTDVWTVNLDDNSSFVKAIIYVAYNWDKSGINGPELNTTFNGANITPMVQYRDQSNLGTSGQYGYGVFVYDVTDLIKTGENTLLIEKIYGLTNLYPSNLIYLYNTTGSKVLTTVYFNEGADLLTGGSYNSVGRIVKTDSTISIDNNGLLSADLYVFASGAQKGEGNIVFNGVETKDVWSGTDRTSDMYKVDITGNVSDSNNISFVATGSTILALNQMIVTTQDLITADVSFKTEYDSVNTCYAGTDNAIRVTVNADKNGTYVVELLADGVVVDSTEIALDGVNENTTLVFDPTVRPVNETTVSGADNTKVNYTVNVKYLNRLIASASKVVPVLYDGYLGKDFAYNATYIEYAGSIAVTGGISINIQDKGTYLAAKAYNRTDVWTVNLDDNSNFVKAIIYVAYNWDKTGINGPEFNTTFNGANITPIAQYRDQSNLGTSGQYGYGVFVYDVTDLIKTGENTLFLEKEYGLTAVYPSNLIYLYNTTGSKVLSTVYYVEGADLLTGSSYNFAGRIVKTDSAIPIDNNGLLSADLYVFAGGAQKGEGNIVFNGVEAKDVWSGTDRTLDMYKVDITGNVSDSNNISFVATGSTILALNQMIVTTKQIASSQIKDMIVYGNGSLAATLADGNGKAIANATVKYAVNGVENTTTTDDAGAFMIDAGSNAVVDIIYDGDLTTFPVNTSIVLKDLAPIRTATKIDSADYTTYSIDFKAGERGNYFKVQLLDADGKALANKAVKIGFNGVVYDRVTDSEGRAQLQINLKNAGVYTFAVAFLGDDEYNGSFVVNKITVNVKTTKISAPAKTFKASAKTKSYTVTLTTIKGSSLDGKTYMEAGKQIKLTINGKTYTANTNSKGQATFKLSLTKKGSYSGTVSFAGDKAYAASKATAKIKIN